MYSEQKYTIIGQLDNKMVTIDPKKVMKEGHKSLDISHNLFKTYLINKKHA